MTPAIDHSAEHGVIFRSLIRLLRPVAMLCLRHSLRLQDLIEPLKHALVSIAKEQLERGGDRITVTRLSLMTGIHRKDIDRILTAGIPKESSQSVIARVIGQWQGDKRFTGTDGSPRALSVGGDSSEFARLVRLVSKELNPASILFELERTGVTVRDGEQVRLARDSYAPADQLEQAFSVLAADSEDLAEAVTENVDKANVIPNLHARTVFDNVRPDDLEFLRGWLMREGHELHRKAREVLSERDQDINPDPAFRGTGMRVVLGTFGRISKR